MTQREELDRVISVSTAERAVIQAKIEAAETLLGKKSAMGAPRTPEIPMKKLVAELMADGVRRNPTEIREALIARGVDPIRVGSDSGNFYNAVRRLMLDGYIAKEADSRYRLTNDKPGSGELPGLSEKP